jgi:hypothetical protein
MSESFLSEEAPDFGSVDDLVRPFTARVLAGRGVGFGEPDEMITPLVRPYFVTGGRTRTHRPLAIEALATLTERGHGALASLRLERLVIARICVRPTSVAEIASRAGLHLGVVRVLLSDMASEDLVTTSDAPLGVADDIDLITRLIHGVRAL